VPVAAVAPRPTINTAVDRRPPNVAAIGATPERLVVASGPHVRWSEVVALVPFEDEVGEFWVACQRLLGAGAVGTDWASSAETRPCVDPRIPDVPAADAAPLGPVVAPRMLLEGRPVVVLVPLGDQMCELGKVGEPLTDGSASALRTAAARGPVRHGSNPCVSTEVTDPLCAIAAMRGDRRKWPFVRRIPVEQKVRVLRRVDEEASTHRRL